MNFHEYMIRLLVCPGVCVKESFVHSPRRTASQRELRGVVLEAPRHHGITPQQVRTFRPDVCCDHEWYRSAVADLPDVCEKCGATCLRGRDGQIEEYEAVGS